jgi:hypothetical protein
MITPFPEKGSRDRPTRRRANPRAAAPRRLKKEVDMTSKKKSPTADLVKLVEYMEDDEAKHFDQMTLNGEDTSDHIYHSVRAVRDWLNANGVQTRPAWWRLSADAAARIDARSMTRGEA